jgi:hypothetical protein
VRSGVERLRSGHGRCLDLPADRACHHHRRQEPGAEEDARGVGGRDTHRESGPTSRTVLPVSLAGMSHHD